jgi:hypothetical protein
MATGQLRWLAYVRMFLHALTCLSFFQFELGATAAVASAAAAGFAFRLLADVDADDPADTFEDDADAI